MFVSKYFCKLRKCKSPKHLSVFLNLDGHVQPYLSLYPWKTHNNTYSFCSPAFDEVRQADTIAAGRDRRKVDESSDSRASKDDKRSLESIQGSRAEYRSDSDLSTTSYSSSSASSTSSRGKKKRKGRKDKKRAEPREDQSKTPPPIRELSPPRKPLADDFFDKKPDGPTFTFRGQHDENQAEFLTGYKVYILICKQGILHVFSRNIRVASVCRGKVQFVIADIGYTTSSI